MLLRRLAKHVREQNWLAVLLDFLIVIAGVLIAFQITAWGERQSERQRAEIYLDNLETALAVQVELLGNLRDGYDYQLELGHKVISLLDSETLSESDRVTFEMGISLAGQIQNLDPGGVLPLVDLALEERVLIEDAEIRELLRGYAWQARMAKDIQDRLIERINGTVQVVDRFAAVGPPGGQSRIDGQPFVAYDFDRLRDSPEFRTAFASTFNMLRVDRRSIVGGLNGAEYMLAELRRIRGTAAQEEHRVSEMSTGNAD